MKLLTACLLLLLTILTVASLAFPVQIPSRNTVVSGGHVVARFDLFCRSSPRSFSELGRRSSTRQYAKLDLDKVTPEDSVTTSSEEDDALVSKVDLTLPPTLTQKDKAGFNMPSSTTLLILGYAVFVILDTIFHFTPQDMSYGAAFAKFIREMQESSS